MKNRRRFTITLGAILMVCMLLTGYAAVAAEYDSVEDPLITQSYLEQVLKSPLARSTEDVEAEPTRHQSAIEKTITAMSRALDNKVATLAAKLSRDDAINRVTEAGGIVQGDGWATVTVEQGKTLNLDANAEIILRQGSATCVESAGTGLLDLTRGGILSADAALETDHRYLATTQGAGLRATGTATILVYGSYTLA